MGKGPEQGCVCCVLSCLSQVQFFGTLETVAHQAPLSIGFSRQENWSGLPCSPPGDLPDPGIEPTLLCLLHWQVGSLPLMSSGSLNSNGKEQIIVLPQQSIFFPPKLESYLWIKSSFLRRDDWTYFSLLLSIWFLVSVVNSVHSLCHVQLFATPGTAGSQTSLSITNTWSLLTLMSVELVIPSNHLILYHPLLLLPSIFPRIRVFSKESVLCIRWPKFWSFSLSISPSNEYSGLIYFRIDWFDLLTLQGTLGSLLQNHSSKASILQHSAFFIDQLSYPYMTTGKTVALTIQTFFGKVMSLLFSIKKLVWVIVGNLSKSTRAKWKLTICAVGF